MLLMTCERAAHVMCLGGTMATDKQLEALAAMAWAGLDGTEAADLSLHGFLRWATTGTSVGRYFTEMREWAWEVRDLGRRTRRRTHSASPPRVRARAPG